MAEEHDEECTCLGDGDVILRELRILEVLSAEDGEIYKIDWSNDGSGNPLEMADVLELAEFAKAMATAPLVADLVFGYMQSLDEG